MVLYHKWRIKKGKEREKMGKRGGRDEKKMRKRSGKRFMVYEYAIILKKGKGC
jgi:hypothetical protein